jgi:hypothetical protein
MTAQEIFDFVLAHARKQNAKALSSIRPDLSGQICSYRTPEGLKCFAGALIKDEFYNPIFEGYSATHAPVTNALVKSGLKETQIPYVVALQNIHDLRLPEEWEERFQAAALELHLEYTSPT